VPLFKIHYICPECQHVYLLTRFEKPVFNYALKCQCGKKIIFNKELTSAVYRILRADIVGDGCIDVANKFEKSDFEKFDDYCQNEKKGLLPDAQDTQDTDWDGDWETKGGGPITP